MRDISREAQRLSPPLIPVMIVSVEILLPILMPGCLVFWIRKEFSLGFYNHQLLPLCRLNPDVAKSESNEPGQAGRKGFGASLLPNHHIQIVSLSEVTKTEFLPFPLNLLKTAVRNLGEQFVQAHFCNGRLSQYQ
jgi:hypothetical protein